MKNKCLGCLNPLEEGFLFCSITCACLCGYMHVRADGPKRDPQELIDNPKLKEKFLNNPPLRERSEKKY